MITSWEQYDLLRIELMHEAVPEAREVYALLDRVDRYHCEDVSFFVRNAVLDCLWGVYSARWTLKRYREERSR